MKPLSHCFLLLLLEFAILMLDKCISRTPENSRITYDFKYFLGDDLQVGATYNNTHNV